MIILFSEAKSDYTNYVFPYAIWAIPEAHETPAMLMNSGFLPASRDMDRFYMCRNVRIDLTNFSQSSENRRIMRKCSNITYTLKSRGEFNYTSDWRQFCQNYADIKFGKDVMSFHRLDSLFNSKIISHVMLFADKETNRDVGITTLYIEGNTLAFYYYAFYDLNYYSRNLGMFMMTATVEYMSRQGFHYLYLGSCYSENALYKTQFSGFEFFNGFRWSNNLDELKYLIRREEKLPIRHVLETTEYLEKFYENDLKNVVRLHSAMTAKK